MKKSAKKKFLTLRQEARLAKRIQAGDTQAAEELVLAYKPFIAARAENYLNCGVDKDDLVSAGISEAFKCCSKFDPKIARFSTYIAKPLKGAFTSEINRMSTCVAKSNYETRKQVEASKKGSVDFDFFANPLALDKKLMDKNGNENGCVGDVVSSDYCLTEEIRCQNDACLEWRNFVMESGISEGDAEVLLQILGEDASIEEVVKTISTRSNSRIEPADLINYLKNRISLIRACV